ncbi:Vacuolar protein sorting-associated protein 37B [Larimichthys crocea]|uniref:Vacuolar protein sorting-associated protein 37B n=2 Tax=Larimichthys crocea TaxID=215358 RepID=A0A6G0IJW7_LARCR|nr:vacuolar protein sorting-associated protein 37B isoform X2 [Larimichthys crocea]KAE8291551.1 Vacuolar protein sorting-associated protein 37B [Larimichthys crocea]TMS03816.1 Vacuolar protein sorting-associated protein 37B [Larimichthys crocea]
MSSFNNKFSSYTMTQLNEILEDDDKLTKMVQDMEEMQEVQQSKEMTLVTNRTLAEQNLALQPRLEHKKEQLTKRYSCLQENFESYQLRKSTLDHSSGNTSLDTLLALLQAEGAKIEEETENMADSFLDGDMTLDAFIDAYQSNRKLAHLRRVKIEKLQEMVLQGQRLPQALPVPTSRSQDVSVAARPSSSSLLTETSNSSSPIAQPRRKPPPPPSQPAPILNSAPAAAPQPPVFCSASPYPPIPPRTGQPFPNVPSGYPNHFISQYPPALPQRPSPRMAPQPGFIMQ